MPAQSRSRPLNQALSGLLFLYRYVLDQQLGELGDVIRARKSKRLPVVLTREEVKAVLNRLKGEPRLIAVLISDLRSLISDL